MIRVTEPSGWHVPPGLRLLRTVVAEPETGLNFRRTRISPLRACNPFDPAWQVGGSGGHIRLERGMLSRLQHLLEGLQQAQGCRPDGIADWGGFPRLQAAKLRLIHGCQMTVEQCLLGNAAVAYPPDQRDCRDRRAAAETKSRQGGPAKARGTRDARL